MPFRNDPIRSSQHRDLLHEAARAALALGGRSAEIEAQRHLPQDIAYLNPVAGVFADEPHGRGHVAIVDRQDVRRLSRRHAERRDQLRLARRSLPPHEPVERFRGRVSGAAGVRHDA